MEELEITTTTCITNDHWIDPHHEYGLIGIANADDHYDLWTIRRSRPSVQNADGSWTTTIFREIDEGLGE